MRFRNFSNVFALCAILVLALTVSGSALAKDSPYAFDLRLTGFGTAAAMWSGDDDFAVRRDISREGGDRESWDFAPDSLIGVQLDAQFTERSGASLQLVGKDRTDNSLENAVQWAYGYYAFTPNTKVRIGRVGFDVFMLSEYRDLGFAYLWVRPPIEFYGSLAFEYFDGIDLTHTHPVGSGVLRSKLSFGKSSNDFVARDPRGEPSSVDVSPAWSFTLGWENDDWRLQLGVAQLEMSDQISAVEPLRDALMQLSPFWPAAQGVAKDFDADGKKLRYYSTGFSYHGSPWRVDFEAALIDTDFKAFPDLFSSYASVGYRVGDLTLFGMAALAKNTESRERVPAAPPVPAFQAVRDIAQTQYDLGYIDQHTLSLGARWDVRHNMALKFQWDHTWVDAYGGGLFDHDVPVGDDEEVNVLTFSLDFVF